MRAEGEASYGGAIDVDALIRLRDLVRRAERPRRPAFGPPGALVAKRRGRGLETVDVRAYVVGDDVRHIDHNVTARTGEPHVKSFHDEQDETAVLIADFRPEMLWGARRALRSVAAAEALCVIGWRVIAQGGRVGLVALGGAGPEMTSPRPREQGMLRVIGALARAHGQALEALQQGRRETRPLGGALHIVDGLSTAGARSGRRSLYLATAFDHPGGDFDLWARAVQRRAALHVLLIRDGFETRPPRGVYPVLTEEGRRLWLRVSEKRASNSPREDAAAHLEQLGARVVRIDAASGPEMFAPQLLGRSHG